MSVRPSRRSARTARYRSAAAAARRIGNSADVSTHGHPDHIGGVQEIARASGAQVLMHQADMERLRIRFREVISGRPAPGAIIAYLTQAPTDVTAAEEGDELPLLGGLRVLHTP